MPYFDKLGEDDKRGHLSYNEASSIDNKPVTEDMLRLKIKQIVQEEFFHQVEPVEVLDVRENYNKDNAGVNDGIIAGRFIFSETNKPFDRCLQTDSLFIPLNPNMIQMPLPGEIVLGFEFAGQRYYFSSMNDRPELINYDMSGVSMDDAEIINGRLRGSEAFAQIPSNAKYFKDVSTNIKGSGRVFQGDTLIQGRHNNYIHLSSNQHRDSDNNVTDENDFKSGNIYIGINNGESLKRSSITLTTNEQVNYPLDVITTGLSMNKSSNGRSVLSNRDQFVANGFTEPSIFMNSNRIVLNSKTEDIAIFAKGNVHIKGTKVQIRNSRQISLSANEVVNETKKLYRLKEDLKSGNVLLLPDGIVERGRTLAEKHQENILHFIDQLNSLIPAAIPGTRSIPNPAWLNNIRTKIKNARDRLRQNKLIISLKWLDFDSWKTYTIDELREAWSPVPGMADVLSKLSNLKDLVEDVKNLKQEYEVAKAKFEEYKAIAKNPAEYFENLILAKVETLTFDDFVEIEVQINDFESAGGDLSEIENGEALKKESGQLKAEYEAIIQNQGSPGFQSRLDSWKDKAEKFTNKVKSGFANGFNMSIVNREIEITTQETTVMAAESLSEAVQAGEQAQKNLRNV